MRTCCPSLFLRPCSRIFGTSCSALKYGSVQLVFPFSLNEPLPRELLQNRAPLRYLLLLPLVAAWSASIAARSAQGRLGPSPTARKENRKATASVQLCLILHLERADLLALRLGVPPPNLAKPPPASLSIGPPQNRPASPFLADKFLALGLYEDQVSLCGLVSLFPSLSLPLFNWPVLCLSFGK